MPEEGDRYHWVLAIDIMILKDLSVHRADYVALIASRNGIHNGYTERRCRVLVEHGLIEPVSAEVVYRITQNGRQFLEETQEAGVIHDTD